jgi:hypothetical protein
LSLRDDAAAGLIAGSDEPRSLRIEETKARRKP